jgi:hypothetical protein
MLSLGLTKLIAYNEPILYRLDPLRMIMNSMSLSQPSAFADRSLNLNILIRETLEGDLIARVLEFPEWMVQAANRQEAIEKLENWLTINSPMKKLFPSPLICHPSNLRYISLLECLRMIQILK